MILASPQGFKVMFNVIYLKTEQKKGKSQYPAIIIKIKVGRTDVYQLY